ncbi:uncharacterized protein [Dermacentor albipictus]|uniref:uncharacterized protein isoform X2 n=1 Tax=Dermacentor albipictus TaxID=60249 RepID=UPI0031FE1E1A
MGPVVLCTLRLRHQVKRGRQHRGHLCESEQQGPAWEAARWPTLPAAAASGLVTWWPAVIEHRHLDAQPVGQLVSSSIGLVSWCPHCRLGDPLFWRPGDCPCCGPGGQLL